MPSPEISVVLPVYNQADLLTTAVASILDQSFSDFELLIVNDGSTDNIGDAMAQIRDPRIKVISKTHTGLADSLNMGIQQSRGMYIVRMDADDIALPGRLEAQHHFLEENPFIDVCATRVKYEGPDDSAGIQHYIEWQNQLLDPDEIYRNRFVDAPLVHPSVMVRKSAFEQYGYYTTKKEPEDYQLWLSWLHQGAQFAKVEKQLLVWRDSSDRLTRTHANYNRDHFFRLKAQYFALWFNNTFTRYQPGVWVCGVGRSINRRVKWLKDFGINIEGFVDVKAGKQKHIISYDEIGTLPNPFFLSYVSDRLGRIEIRDFLIRHGKKEGIDFLIMA